MMHQTDDVAAVEPPPDETPGLLGRADPAAVDCVCEDSTAPILLLCEHAGQAVPSSLMTLGLSKEIFDLHIGWDIGAEALARSVADHLQAPLILQRYSRLVMDCNRPPGVATSIPEISDGVPVPGNLGLSDAEKTARKTGIFDPMNAAINDAFAAHPRRSCYSIHSFTPHLSGRARIWDAGFLSRRDLETAGQLMTAVARQAPHLQMALNEPYQIDDTSDWFIPAHAEPRGLRHCLIEIRNDHLRDEDGIATWARWLAAAIEEREALP
ncbi:MAG: N-formylglutamate amidohydrolase [Pseudomonadota bacterium]